TIFDFTFDVIDLHPLEPRVHHTADLKRQFGFAKLAIVQGYRTGTDIRVPEFSASIEFQFLLRTSIHFESNLVGGLAVADTSIDVVDFATANLRPNSGLNLGRKLLKLNFIGVRRNEQRAAQKRYRSQVAFFHTYTNKHRFPAYRA